VKTAATTRKAAARFVQWKESVVHLNPGTRIRLVRAGVPSDLLVSAAAHFGIPRNRFAALLGMSPGTAERKIKAGTLLGQSPTERLERMALTETHAVAVFGSTDLARDWLTQRDAVLGGTPLFMLDTETGASEVRKVLSAIACGGTA
jgi:putative toxin-antitoxin system antitoxin component (TIGR02293 family)